MRYPIPPRPLYVSLPYAPSSTTPSNKSHSAPCLPPYQRSCHRKFPVLPSVTAWHSSHLPPNQEFIIPLSLHPSIHPSIGSATGKTRRIFPLIPDSVPGAWLRRVGLRRTKGREGRTESDATEAYGRVFISCDTAHSSRFCRFHDSTQGRDLEERRVEDGKRGREENAWREAERVGGEEWRVVVREEGG